MNKMIVELTDAIGHLNKKAQRAQETAKAALAAAEDAHAAAEQAQYLLAVAAIMEGKRKSDILRHSVTLECDEPVLSWTSQTIHVDEGSEFELADGEITVTVTLDGGREIDLDACELDALEPDSAEVEFSVGALVESISNAIVDHANGDDQIEAAIETIADDLRERLLDY